MSEEAEISISSKESKIRKWWLYTTVFYLTGCSLICSAILFVLSYFTFISEEVILECLAYSFAGLIPLACIYYCAYKKPGTCLLTFWLIACPFRFLADIIKDFKEWGVDGWTVGEAVFRIMVFLSWYVLSIKLRQINKNIKDKKLLKLNKETCVL